MAKGFNQVIMVGNLTRDPELRTTPNGQSVCSFSLAVNRSWTNSSGEQQEAVDFHDCVAWGKAGEIINQYMTKGRKLMVIGRLQNSTWDAQDGTKRKRTEIVVTDFTFLDGGGVGAAGNRDTNFDDSLGGNTPTKSSPKPAPNKADNAITEDDEDSPVDLSDIPF